MNYGTIFEVTKTKAIRHRVPQAEWETVCGIDLYAKIPANWPPKHKPGWNIEHELPKEIRCKKCYPNFKKRRKP